jgi:hypothetical protein
MRLTGRLTGYKFIEQSPWCDSYCYRAVRREARREDAGSDAMIDDHRPKRSIGVDGEGVGIVGSLFDDNERLAIWADRDRRAAGVGGSESGGGLGIC